VGVDGSVAKGYEVVVDSLAGCGSGIAVVAFVGGRRVVDVWSADLSADTLLCTWSVIKPVTGSCLLLLVERGVIDLDDPVVATWPELGDDRLLIRHLLSHTAGRVTVPDVPLVDWDRSVAALARLRPDWPAGEVVCEHAMTFGHLVGEVVRRVDGRSLGRFLAEELTGPLGLDVHVGVGDADLPRVAETIGLDRRWWAAARGAPGSVRHRALGPWMAGVPRWPPTGQRR
jgi:CubicO group peptidase (beta-lactamase class C family)